MRIFITGATGFIGSHLLPFLNQQDWQIVTASRSYDISNKLLNNITQVPIGEIDGNTNWQNAINGIDTVIHLAARAHILQDKSPNPEADFFKVNTEGTANLVKQSIAAGVKHFVFISSIGAIASESNHPLTENTSPQPDTPYRRSKRQAEIALIDLASHSNMTWTILRPPLVYGAGNPGNMERLVKLIDRGLPLPFGLVKNRRSLIYVGNLVDAIATTLTHPKATNQIFLVSDGQDLSTPQLIRKIADNRGQPCKLLPVPPSLLKIAGYLGDTVEHLSKKPLPLNTPTINRLLGSLFIDSSHIQTTLNWQPPYTIDEGLLQTLRK
ncbi:NAD-dependent epimerase/dehydratase family protein [Funiculus sociatus GB2-A5]|uniref:NAD-dependent epimerase/dehydratase family protein n=1 Tax=Funiculus sociatus GB2-A5 TaxID=2933946 RepID=A0ABV0JQS6_9CYAN|nr:MULTISPECIES: NAD-dependent epimerase/dehydratase family protein [unclassified Trichocoleus]MBD1906698.1 NAD-dependent epimerase/dehydratase family protein [Trichocoleus sp. FACHB-832]MBD2063135.1 NAD-dependent epimerase/dehydratase family protein [Trichocoleus sp. FACHB-6]